MELLDAADPRLSPSADPARSSVRLREARLTSAGQRHDREQVLSLLERHGTELAVRTCTPGHLTGSALVVDPSGPRVLLLLHAKLGRWLQPGGHADGDHELAGVALREATEETGIEGLVVLVPALDLDIHAVDHGDELGRHLHLDLRFLVVAPEGAEARGNHESLAMRWVAPRDVGPLCGEDGLVRLLGTAQVALGELTGAPPW